MKHESPIELRSAVPIETRDEGGDDPLAAVTAAVTEIRTAQEQFQQRTDQRLETDLAALRTRLDTIDTRTQRPGGGSGGGERTDEAAAIETRAFVGYLRRGRESLTDVEVRALRVSDDTAGGFLATPEFTTEVDRNIVQFSPVRQAARVGQTASGSVIIPKRTGRPTGYWVGETEERDDTQSAYGQAEIPIDEIACYVDVSNKLLEDAAIDVGAEVAFDLSEEFGRMEGEAFVSGNGTKKPLGVMSDTNLSYTPAGHATLIQADGLISIFYALAPFYRQRGAWLLNGSTLAAIRKLKDGQGQYLWQPGLTLGQPETILGRPAIEAVDMPDIAADAFPVAFGDFSTGFRIYDRIAFSILRDPYSMATKGLTRFHARRRVGARVVRAEAIRKLKIATS